VVALAHGYDTRVVIESDVLDRAPPLPDARLRYGPDESQFGDLRIPQGGGGPYPVVVVIHGGFWRAQYDLGHIGHLCEALAREGIATWSLEYRRIGEPHGGWPGTFRDVVTGTAHLRPLAVSFPLDLGRVFTLGHSAGGHLAIWLASSRRLADNHPLVPASLPSIRGAVSLAGVLDLRRASDLRLSRGVTDELLGGSPGKVPERYATTSPIDMLPVGVPRALVHGEADDVVPIEISRRYLEAAAARGDQVSLTALPNVGHFEVIDPLSHAWPPVLAAVLSMPGLGTQDAGLRRPAHG
jgi:acetyl esterase/lipase